MDKSQQPLNNSASNGQLVNTNTFLNNTFDEIYTINLHLDSGYNAVSKNEVASG